ncbi:hypothetical protein H0X06_01310 [Candidatus Dependentiae bacterium]|nr:hypothetical protein [Candidatus Dependentiae bacterium]
MIKSSAVITAVGVSLVCVSLYAERTLDSWFSAIEKIDVARIEKLLKRDGIINAQEKKELLAAAEDAVEECEKNVSLLKSKSDLALCGTGLGVISLGVLVGRPAISMGLIGAGVYLALKSWRCPYALRCLANAEEIEYMIKNAPLSSEHNGVKS